MTLPLLREFGDPAWTQHPYQQAESADHLCQEDEAIECGCRIQQVARPIENEQNRQSPGKQDHCGGQKTLDNSQCRDCHEQGGDKSCGTRC